MTVAERASRSPQRTPMRALLTLLPCLVACSGQLVEFPFDAGDTPFDGDASATAQRVDAPDYTLDTSGIRLVTDVRGVVQSATGHAALSGGLITGQRYAVVHASGLTTFAALDDAFIAATGEALTLDIPAAAFALVNDDLSVPRTRTLIIANVGSGVPSYQAFEVSFRATHHMSSR